MSKDQAIGGAILVVCVAVALFYPAAARIATVGCRSRRMPVQHPEVSW